MALVPYSYGVSPYSTHHYGYTNRHHLRAAKGWAAYPTSYAYAAPYHYDYGYGAPHVDYGHVDYGHHDYGYAGYGCYGNWW
eukprot:NODE_3144_length_975_cov_25.558315_g2621_i0.p5 GENE.NODE_3144_length_975_cov_25.558315_g2621_i0~~NODE_3144_length_975_cov_25.558315_g2621_i0.p5  ORF type:complete len:81 (+),score=4.45 NODE_3144_length_975_cov_25.558315_g2621_i0:158-400(+)